MSPSAPSRPWGSYHDSSPVQDPGIPWFAQPEDRPNASEQAPCRHESEGSFTHHAHVTNIAPIQHGRMNARDHTEVPENSSLDDFGNEYNPSQAACNMVKDLEQAAYFHDQPRSQIQPFSGYCDSQARASLASTSTNPLATSPGYSTATVVHTPVNVQTGYISPEAPVAISSEYKSRLVASMPFGEGYYPNSGENWMTTDPSTAQLAHEPCQMDNFHGDSRTLRYGCSQTNCFSQTPVFSPSSSAQDIGSQHPLCQQSPLETSVANEAAGERVGTYLTWDSKTGQRVLEPEKKRRPTFEERWETRVMRATGVCAECKRSKRKVWTSRSSLNIVHKFNSVALPTVSVRATIPASCP